MLAGDRQFLRTGYDLQITGPEGERRIPLCYSHMTIGSSNGDKPNDIVVDDPGVANRQGLLKLIQGQIYFNNIQPGFAVTLNGAPLVFGQVKDGDELQIGSTVIKIQRLSEKVAFLEGYTEPHRKEHWTLGATSTQIGRPGKRTNAVVLDDPTVSREHATIEYTDGVFVLRPETEKPTWVNSEPVTGMRILKDEDLIQVGQQLLRFRTYQANTKPRALSPRDATILFSDIWDYTSLAESRPLEETISQLNEVYKGLGKVIVDEQGILMTYLGDAMMAVFGAGNEAHAQHAEQAVRAALKMLDKLEELNVKWEAEGKPALRIGIGIASGEVMVGDVGVTGHREFAAMGDTTNIASRIEKLTRDFDARVLIAASTEESVRGRFKTNSLGTTEIRGRRSPVHVYEVLREPV